MFVCQANEQLDKPGGKPVLLEHFFQVLPATHVAHALPSKFIDLTADEDEEWEMQSGSLDDNEFQQLELGDMTDKPMLSVVLMSQWVSNQHTSGSLNPPDPPKVHSCPCIPPPTQDDAYSALKMLMLLLCPPQNKGYGYKDLGLDLLTRQCMEAMTMLLRVFTEDNGIYQGRWINTSESVALAWGKSKSYAKPLHKWCHALMEDKSSLPRNPYGAWNTSILLMDEDLRAEIETYLQLKGNFVHAMDIVDCVSQEHLMVHLRQKKLISVQTARHWMKLMGYCWQKDPKGQYADGHESPEVVKYCQQVFLLVKMGRTPREGILA